MKTYLIFNYKPGTEYGLSWKLLLTEGRESKQAENIQLDLN